MISDYLYHLSLRSLLHCLVGILFVAITACDHQASPELNSTSSDEVRTFTGTWSATGNRQLMQLESDHQAGIFRLSGSLLLEGQQRLRKGFRADLIGFFDNRDGMQGRSVWTDERGDKVFSELRGEAQIVNTVITGTILGGTGRYTGVTGDYTFKWRRLIANESGEISGRTVDFKGWARLKSSDTSQGMTGHQ